MNNATIDDITETIELFSSLSNNFQIDDSVDFMMSIEIIKQLRKLESVYTAMVRETRSKMQPEQQLQLSLIMQDERPLKPKKFTTGILSDYRLRSV